MTPEEALASERQNVGAGWQPLIDELDAQLRVLDAGYSVDQIKEKFGGLRYYITPSADTDETVMLQVTDLLWAAEEKSFTVCEDCGSTEAVSTQGRHAGRGWIRTLCGDCRG